MHDKQNQHCSVLNRHRAHYMPALLAAIIDPVETEDAMRILENQRRCFKAYAAVLALVEEILSFISLAAHLYIQIVSRMTG
jgi:hypothetical protein